MSDRDMHVMWCHHRGTDELHDEIPYCYKQVHGVKLIPGKGEQFPEALWVSATRAAHPSALTSGRRAPDDHAYDGIELAVERYSDGKWSEQKMRLSSDAARSLAAALVRAADVEQGLTR